VVKRGTYFFPAFSIGKWTQETCLVMLDELSKRMNKPDSNNKLTIYTDGNDDYTFTIPNVFDVTKINYGQIVKIRNSQGKLLSKEYRVIYGTPDIEDIETVNIENFNGIFRERIGRFVRKTKCFSKKKGKLCNAIDLFQFYWNFMNDFKRGESPAIMEGLSNHLWSWHEFLMFHYAI